MRTLAVLLAAVLAASPAFAAEGHKAKAALDDRVDANGAVGAPEVGKGEHMGRAPTLPGAYFGDRAREAVRAYYAAHPPVATVPLQWQVGDKLPAGAAVQPVPSAIKAKLPKLPPGHQYVEVAGNILLIAAKSRMIVDGIAR